MVRGNTKRMLGVMSRGENGERKHKKDAGNDEEMEER